MTFIAAARFGSVELVSSATCPFCHQCYPEPAPEECPQCGVHLVSAEQVSTMQAARAALLDDEEEAPLAPDEQPLPWTYLGRGKGELLGAAAAGLAAFFLPWVYATYPRQAVFSGLDIARRNGVTWAVAAAWFTLLPLVVSRRSIRQMRGARLIAAVLSAMPLISAGVLMAFPPKAIEVRSAISITNRFDWGAGVYATIAIGVVAVLISVLRFGGAPLPSGAHSGETKHEPSK